MNVVVPTKKRSLRKEPTSRLRTRRQTVLPGRGALEPRTVNVLPDDGKTMPHRHSQTHQAPTCPTLPAPTVRPKLPTDDTPPIPETISVLDSESQHTSEEIDLRDKTAVAALNRQAAILENVFFPAQAVSSLSLGDNASVTAMRLFLARAREEAGTAGDTIEKILLDQLVVAHLKVGELYASASDATKLEFKGMYNNAAVRLLGCICSLTSTLASYRISKQSRAHAKKTKTGRRTSK